MVGGDEGKNWNRKITSPALSNRYVVLRDTTQIKITDAAQVAAVFPDFLALEDAIARDTEHYFVMHLDVRHTVKLVELVSIGVLDSARVHPRETFRRAIIEGSASIIVAHNHPSGTVTPSDDDIRATGTLHQAGQLLDIIPPVSIQVGGDEGIRPARKEVFIWYTIQAENMKNTDDFWAEHHRLFDGHFAYFDRTGQKKTPVWGKYHVADEHYFDVRYELVPITKPSGTRTYIMLHPYVLQPKLTMTVVCV